MADEKDNMTNLEAVKLLLAIDSDKKDKLLTLIIDNTTKTLLFKLSADKVPDQLNFIVQEVTVKRFNRINNEGMSSYSQDGESITFKTNDFDDYLADIDKWRQDNLEDENRSVRFYNTWGN